MKENSSHLVLKSKSNNEQTNDIFYSISQCFESRENDKSKVHLIFIEETT